MNRIFLLAAASTAAISAIGAYADTLADNSAPVETVIVTASPLSNDADATASITGKVDRDTILQSSGGNLADALETIPGVTGSSFASGASRPIIRGFDSNRVRIMEDGIGAFDVSDVGPDHGVPVDPLAAQEIEVVRGAATLRYGSQAIGGVVNAINNRVPLAQTEKPSAEVSGVFGSSAGLGQLSASTDFTVDNVGVHLDGFYRNAGDYDTPDGRMDNSFFRANGFSIGSSYFFGDANRVGAALIQYDSKYGIPGEDSHILMRQTKILSRDSFDFGGSIFGTLNIDAGYANYSHEEIEADGEVATTFKNREFDVRAEQLIGAIGPFSSSAIGIQAQHREYSALGEDSAYLYPAYTTSYAGFLFTEAPLTDALRLQISGRIENIHVTGTPASDTYTERDFTPLSGAAGLLYTPDEAWTLGLTFSSAARAPAQTELFARGGHDGPATYETGDPTLKTERSNSLEATVRFHNDRLSFEGSLWNSWFDNYIYGALTGRMCDEDGICTAGSDEELKELNYTQSGAYFRGIEAKANYRLFEFSSGTLSATAQADYVRATLNGGDNVPRIPPWHLGGGLNWTAAEYDVGFLAIYAGKQTDYGRYDTETSGYLELNAHITWRPLPGLELALVGHNLTDDVQRNAAAFNKDEIELPGRDFRLVLRKSI